MTEESKLPDIPSEKAFELHYDFSRECPIPTLVGCFFRLHSFDNEDPQVKSYYPVIKSVKHLDSGILEIRRAMIFRPFFN